MKKLIIILFLFGANLNAQVPRGFVHTDTLGITLLSELNKLSDPQLDAVMNVFVQNGYALDHPGNWTMAIIDSISFPEGITWHYVGNYAFGMDLYPFDGENAAAPVFVKYKQILVIKANKEIIVTPGTQVNPQAAFLAVLFAENGFPSKSQAESRRQN